MSRCLLGRLYWLLQGGEVHPTPRAERTSRLAPLKGTTRVDCGRYLWQHFSFLRLTMFAWAFLLSLPIALGLFGLWVLCRLMSPANAPLLAAVRVGGIVYYLVLCLLTFSPTPISDWVHKIYQVKPWGRYLVEGMGFDKSHGFHNVFVLALWLAAPAGWLAARDARRNLPFD
jgi:hypothetical protein